MFFVSQFIPLIQFEMIVIELFKMRRERVLIVQQIFEDILLIECKLRGLILSDLVPVLLFVKIGKLLPDHDVLEDPTLSEIVSRLIEGHIFLPKEIIGH